MSDKKLKQRNEIPKEYKWNIEAMYPNEEDWEKDVADSIKMATDFSDFKGKITESSATLLDALKKGFNLAEA